MTLHTGSWIALNAGDRSVLRFEKTIMADPASYYITHPQPMHIAIVLEANGLNDEALKFFKIAYERNPRAH